jgi:hypothetical protein
MDAPLESLVKLIGRALEESAKDMENHHSEDHATGAAAYAGADAIRRVAGVISYVLIGTEDFSHTRDEKLLAFADATLAIMETDEEWSPDTLESVSAIATDLKLATSDDDAMFKRTER